MEAKCSFTFQSSQPDELPFRENDVVKVRNIDDKDWFHAELKGKTGLVPSTYIQMEPHDWYKGNISRLDAENLLGRPVSGRSNPDGFFLVRDCQTDRNQFSLSVLHGNRPQHFKILSNPNGTYYLWPDKTFPSINKLIDYHRTVSVAREPNTKIFLRDAQDREELYEAMFDFAPEAGDELRFVKGSKIRVTDKSDTDWWSGEDVATGRKGYLPSNYVQKLK